MENMTINMMMVIDILNDFNTKTRHLSEIEFLSLVGVLIDRYAAEHGKSCAEMHETLYDTASAVFEEMGEFGRA